MDKQNRKAIIAGNWKMNKTATEAKALISELIPAVKDAGCEVVICVPFTDLVTAVEMTKGTNIHVGAENVHFEKSGAFTGEISADMLTDLGVEYVVIGHSERRQYFAETNETVNKRTKAALAGGLKPIICVGESLDQREQGVTEELVRMQVKIALNGVTADELKNVVIAVMHPQDEDHDEPWRELVVVGVPGDRTVDMKRLEAQFTPAEIEEATDEDLKKHPELVKGYIGPMALGPQARDGKKAENASETGDALRYLIDAHVARGSAWFTGADEQDVDYYDLVYGRDFEADGTVEAVQVRHGDMSPDGSGPLSFERGVEIGQVFQLGLKYSNALGLKVLDQNGKTVPVWMGSYGIGVSRVMACIAETHHDEKGLAWPAVIAPAQVHGVATGKDAAAFEAAEQLIGELEAKGIEVIFDDRKKVSPGVKFKDAELIGVPIIAVAGRDTVNNGTIEVRDRNGENAEAVPVADAAQAIADRVAALLK